MCQREFMRWNVRGEDPQKEMMRIDGFSRIRREDSRLRT